MMQWFINEVRGKFDSLTARVDEAIDRWAEAQVRYAEDMREIRGEIKAMKMRAGKNKNNREPENIG